VLGATLVASILKTKKQDQNNLTFNLNFEEINFDYKLSCGANNCPQTKLKGSVSIPTDGSKSVFYSVIIGLILTGILNTYVLMDDLDFDTVDKNKDNKVNIKKIGKLI
jgi:hypothetical protein